ncbi:hypothetical protein [Streptococcus suis]|uniref:hypothetical protein n=1 Tax=Streptococcus suis TaxID=1307 RepID=UPI003BA0690A
MTESEASLWLESKSIRIRRSYSQWEPTLVDFKLIVEETSGRIIGGQLVSTADYIEQMDVLSLAISKDLTVFDLVEHSWLCLPGNTPLVPFIVEAAQEYIRQFYQVDVEGVYAD